MSRPTSTMKSGTSGSTTTMIAAETQSSPSTTSRTPGVTVAASTSCGRYRTKYGSSASSPRVASVTTDGPSPDASQRGPSGDRVRDHLLAQLADGPGGRPVREALLQRGDQGADHHHGRQPGDRRAQHRRASRRRHRVPSACASSSACATTSAAVSDAERGGQGDVPAGRAGVPQQARVERSHWSEDGLFSAGTFSNVRPVWAGICCDGDPLAEHPVRPALVEQDERREDHGDPRHHRERVVRRRRVGDRQRVGGVERAA